MGDNIASVVTCNVACFSVEATRLPSQIRRLDIDGRALSIPDDGSADDSRLHYFQRDDSSGWRVGLFPVFPLTKPSLRTKSPAMTPRRSSPLPPSRHRHHSAPRVHIRSCVLQDGSESSYPEASCQTAQCRSRGDSRTTCSRTSSWMPTSPTKRKSSRPNMTTPAQGRRLGTSSSLGVPVASSYVDAWRRGGPPLPSRKAKVVHRRCS